MFQSMDTVATTTARRRAYRCVRCSMTGLNRVNRRDRIAHHVLKYHVPLDEVPFSCTLCLFRCMDKASQVSHINNYRPHRNKAAEMGVLDHSPFLSESIKPVVLDERYMVRLSKEESAAWLSRQPSTCQEEPDYYPSEDSDDDMIGPGLRPSSLPRVIPQLTEAKTHQGVRAYTPKGPSMPRSQPNILPQPTATALPGMTALSSTIQQPSLPAYPVQSWVVTNPTYSRTAATATAAYPGSISASAYTPAPAALRVLDTCPALSGPIRPEAPALGGFMTPPPVLSLRDALDTPLQDENIMHQLLGDADSVDSLFQDAPRDLPLGGPEPPAKKMRRSTTEAATNTDVQEPAKPSHDFKDLIRSIEKSTKAITDAIDSNTRALRHQSNHTEKMAGALERMARAQEARNRARPRSVSPADCARRVKSSVSKIRK